MFLSRIWLELIAPERLIAKGIEAADLPALLQGPARVQGEIKEEMFSSFSLF